MAMTNRERVQKGFEWLRQGLVPYAEREFQKAFGANWSVLVEERSRARIDREKDGSIRWDTAALLKTMIDTWNEVFAATLGRFERSLVSELLEFRHQWAHEKPFSSDDTLRALDSMQRLLQSASAASQAAEVEAIKFELQRLVFSEQARAKIRSASAIEGSPRAGLKPWREIVTPHEDVRTGRYQQAEFAADLFNVHHGIGGPEYTDPVEFFRRTFITDGLRELLGGALLRLTGKGGDPVVELQTNFGGGKTHSMLALYHLFGGTPTTSLPGLEPILRATGVAKAPKANRAVLVGTHLSVGEVMRKPDGTVVRTLWGEMAWQLGGKEGFRLVADSDAKGTSPGAQVLVRLFQDHAPCLVLIDEWVAYARNTVDRRDLPSGDFEAQATFAQALTEAARAAERTLVVASVPASKIEVGGQNGEFALQTLRNVFERLGTPWRPASADEGFEIVRRRLFEPITDKDAFAHRDAVIDAFLRLYAENRADFPSGCSEGSYRKRLEAAYPIHPDLFDQLYGEWSTLDKFQRTRGVLRLLAKVIHRLYETNDAGLLILPASIPMDDPGVKSELTRYLDDVWEPILSEDVDGPNSLPLELDRGNANFGRYSACRRVARTLYMGTAPGAKGKNPGIDDRRVKLGCTQPGEAPAIFGDALRRISDRAKHIHQDGNRYWISTKANLNRLAEDRAHGLLQEPEALHAEIVRRIREEHRNKAARGDFAGVHCCPDNTSEVHDEPEARLVILGPQHAHRKGQTDTPGMRFARVLLEQRGNAPRIHRNSLVFLAPDAARLGDLIESTAHFLAWKSILEEHEALNLDAFQRRQAESKMRDADETVKSRIQETWTLALIPAHREPAPGAEARPEDWVAWDEIRVQGSDPLAKRTATKIRNDGALVVALGGTSLRLHLDKWLWKDRDHVQVGELCQWFARYLYLQRVVGREVLIEAIRDGLSQMLPDDTFAIATGYDEAAKRYVGLRLRGPAVIEDTSLLVKPAVAKAQIENDGRPKCPACRAVEPAWNPGDQTCSQCGHRPPNPGQARCPRCAAGKPHWETGATRCGKCGYEPAGGIRACPRCGAGEPAWNAATGRCAACEQPPKAIPTVFVGSVRLDGTRPVPQMARINDEVLQHLSTLPGAQVDIRLEVQIRVRNGVPDDVVRTVSENARTLKFDSAGFERE